MRGADSISLVGDLTSKLCGNKLGSCDPIRLSPGAWNPEGSDTMLQALV
jgi:hypothetical protein